MECWWTWAVYGSAVTASIAASGIGDLGLRVLSTPRATARTNASPRVRVALDGGFRQRGAIADAASEAARQQILSARRSCCACRKSVPLPVPVTLGSSVRPFPQRPRRILHDLTGKLEQARARLDRVAHEINIEIPLHFSEVHR